MKLSGLSNQHKSLDGLLACFPESHERDNEHFLLPTIGRLLRHLISLEGPNFWVGSSMSTINFVARDTTHQFDCVPSLAYVDAIGAYYRIKYPVPRELNMPEDAMICFWENSVDQAAIRLLQVIELSDANPSRITASWYWYICQKCNYHHPHYHSTCVRCSHSFPPEVKCQVYGMYRMPESPDGAIIPNNPMDQSGGSAAS